MVIDAHYLMTTRSVRFGVGDPAGARSSEWLVLWSSSTSDVYIAARTLGGLLKASLHESGRCHIRAPDPRKWLSPGHPPRFLDTWSIDPQNRYEFPFGVIIPASELRPGPWSQHKNKATLWLPAKPSAAVEIAVFLTRIHPLPVNQLTSAGWHTTIVAERLRDGRDLLVMAGDAKLPHDKRRELDEVKAQARRVASELNTKQSNLRLLLFASNEQGTRRFVEAAL
ncbi:MAG: hypothetical protein L0338_35275 [Acidobacteria bacterium]|nr:hypothetical protein [Acidobacteriota bacterium]